jgi:hypothetical protein
MCEDGIVYSEHLATCKECRTKIALEGSDRLPSPRTKGAKPNKRHIAWSGYEDNVIRTIEDKKEQT